MSNLMSENTQSLDEIEIRDRETQAAIEEFVIRLCKRKGLDVKKLAKFEELVKFRAKLATEHFDLLLRRIVLWGVDGVDAKEFEKLVELAGFDSRKPGVIKSVMGHFKSLYEMIWGGTKNDDEPSLDKEKKGGVR